MYLLTTSNIMFVIGILGVIFGVYKYFRDPAIAADKMDALLDFRLKNIEMTVAKFTTNDLPHLDAKIDDIHHDVADMKSRITQLATIIEERIPRK